MKNSHKLFFLLLAIFFLIHFPLIYFPLDLNVYETNYPPSQRFVGFFALDLLQGLKLSVWDYLGTAYAGGSLVIAAWTAPFVAVLGPNLFAVKLASFCWQGIAFVLWYFVFRRHYSEGKTFFILLFLVLAPPQITSMFLHSDGYHMDMILWMALSLLVFQRFLDGKLGEAGAGIVLGFLGGFSSWTVLTNLVTVAVIWIYAALWREPKIRKRTFYLSYLLPFLIGISPLIYLNHVMDWRLFEFLNITSAAPPHSVAQFFSYCMWVVRHTLRIFFDPSLSPRFLNVIFRDGYTILYLFSLSGLIWMKRKELWGLRGRFSIEVFGIYFQLILLFLFAGGGYTDMPRYLMPLVPFLGMTMVAAGSHLSEKLGPIGRYAYLSALIIICLVGSLFGNLRILSTRYPEPPSTLFMKGYNYFHIYNILQDKFGAVPSLHRAKFKQLVTGLPISDREELYRYLDFEFYGFAASDFPRMLYFIHELGEPYPILFEALGKKLGGYYAERGYGDFVSFLESSDISREFHPYIFRGLVQDLDETGRRLLCRQVAKESKPLCYEGLGYLEGLDLVKRFEEFDYKNWVEPDFLNDYLRGVGSKAGYHSQQYPERIRELIKTLEDAGKREFLRGFWEGIPRQEDPYRQLEMKKHFQELSS